MVFHLKIVLEGIGASPLPIWLEPVGFGALGVSLFFVASAFSLFFALARRKDRSSRKFYIRRFFRIAPLFYVFTVLSCLGPDFGPPSDFFGRVLTASFLFNLLPGYQIGAVYAGWSVGVEMVFYVLFPAIFLVVNTLERSVAAWIAAALLLWPLDAGLRWLMASYFSHLTRYPTFDLIFFARFLPVFMIGVIAFHGGFALKKLERSREIGAGLLLAALLGLLAFFYLWRGDGLTELARTHLPWPLIEQSIIFGAFLVGLMNAPSRLLVNRFTCFLGTLSYSIYLVHLPLIMNFKPLYKSVLALSDDGGVQYIACAILTFLVLIPVAGLTYVLIERPGIRLGRLMADALP
nr:acyltransferase [Rhodoblastus acidophilus]